MYRIDMWYTIKTLLAKGKSQRAIVRELNISRSTVLKVQKQLEQGEVK